LVSVRDHAQGDQMLLDLARVRFAGDRVERRYQPAVCMAAMAELQAADFTVASPVDLAFDIHKRDDEYRLVGRVSTTLEFTCSRCLEPFALAVAGEFDLRYLSQAVNAGAGEREVEADDLAVAYYCDEVIDLGHLMSEQFYLAMPMKPLCAAGCRGLCPACGANLNRASCECDTSWHDPRLEGLLAMLETRRSE
jgi:uncharacterized protein